MFGSGVSQSEAATTESTLSQLVNYLPTDILLQFIAASRRINAQIVLANRDIHQQQLYFI